MKTKNFDLVFLSFDGAVVKDSEHETLKDAENAFANIGSKWFFYPFGFICKGSRVIEPGEGLIRLSDKKAYSELMFKGRQLKTVIKVFKDTFNKCEDEEADCYQFEQLMIELNRNLIRE